ncbi:MAG: hypothetical protein M3Q44_00975 [bacterium]|nr:hypothetical protein [bacterium]
MDGESPTIVDISTKVPFDKLKLRYLLLLSILLMTISAIANWFIPIDAGLGVFFYLIYYNFIVIGIGMVIVTALLWYKKSTRNVKTISLLFFLLVISPTVLGMTMSTFVIDKLYLYYDSPSFLQQYSKTTGVEVESNGQTVTYAHCRLEKYTNKYTITAIHESRLIFALVNKNGIPYDSFDDLPRQSLSQLFTHKGDDFVRRSVSRTLGTFQIPKGKHEVLIQSKSPFLLAIYDNKPLFTPFLILQGKKDYAELYADNFSKKMLDEVTNDIRAQACKQDSISVKLTNDEEAYFLNKYVYIPNASINLHKGTDTNLYLYNQWPGNSGLDESPLLTIDKINKTMVTSDSNADLYKTVINAFNKIPVHVYLTIIKKDDPYRPPYLPFVEHKDFIEKMKGRTQLLEEDKLYLNRTESYFWVKEPLQLRDYYIHFSNKISSYNIEKFIEIIEQIEPSQIFTKEVLIE